MKKKLDQYVFKFYDFKTVMIKARLFLSCYIQAPTSIRSKEVF